MQSDTLKTRRGFLTLAGTAGAALILPVFSGSSPVVAKEDLQEKGISPVEDLMREHGILRRVLLIYDEALRRLEKGNRSRVSPDTIGGFGVRHSGEGRNPGG